MESREVLMAQLVAIRAAVGTVQAQIEAMFEVLQFEPNVTPPACPHRHVENVGTLGLPEWQCTDCGQVVPQPV